MSRRRLLRGAGATALSLPFLDAMQPVYWELHVEGDTSCGWYSETFPIPIYDSPAPEPT